ncbi:MAG: SDR family NAD(P)-dependent oxidoreductase [Planctomycetota bacterium]
MASSSTAHGTSDQRPLALVTGAGRGIGLAIAKRFAADGYRLELTNLDPQELDVAVAQIGDAVVGAAALDLRDRDATHAWLKEMGQRHSKLEVFVGNAGEGGPDPKDDLAALAHLDRTLELNAGANHRMVRELAPRRRPEPDGPPTLVEGGRGRVILIASLLGRMGVPGFSIYGASKAATIGLARALACDLAPMRITVNAVCPGWTDTAMAQQGFEAIASESATTPAEARSKVEKNLPLGRIVEPDEVAAMVAWLASSAAGAISGQVLTMAAGDFQA